MVTQREKVVTASVSTVKPQPASKAQTTQPGKTASQSHATNKPEIIKKLVIEEVSIDGMCGVY